MHVQSPAIAATGAVFGTRIARIAPAILAALLGVFMLWGVGFSTISAVHNAAHDVRHSTGFPCH